MSAEFRIRIVDETSPSSGGASGGSAPSQGSGSGSGSTVSPQAGTTGTPSVPSPPPQTSSPTNISPGGSSQPQTNQKSDSQSNQDIIDQARRDIEESIKRQSIARQRRWRRESDAIDRQVGESDSTGDEPQEPRRRRVRRGSSRRQRSSTEEIQASASESAMSSVFGFGETISRLVSSAKDTVSSVIQGSPTGVLRHAKSFSDTVSRNLIPRSIRDTFGSASSSVARAAGSSGRTNGLGESYGNVTIRAGSVTVHGESRGSSSSDGQDHRDRSLGSRVATTAAGIYLGRRLASRFAASSPGRFVRRMIGRYGDTRVGRMLGLSRAGRRVSATDASRRRARSASRRVANAARSARRFGMVAGAGSVRPAGQAATRALFAARGLAAVGGGAAVGASGAVGAAGGATAAVIGMISNPITIAFGAVTAAATVAGAALIGFQKTLEWMTGNLGAFSSEVGIAKTRRVGLTNELMIDRGQRLGRRVAGMYDTGTRFEHEMGKLWTEILDLLLTAWEYMQPAMEVIIKMMEWLTAFFRGAAAAARPGAFAEALYKSQGNPTQLWLEIGFAIAKGMISGGATSTKSSGLSADFDDFISGKVEMA